MRAWARVLAVAGLVLGLVVGGFGLFAVHTVRASFPQVSGEVVVPGLDQPVTVVRNDLGVPDIYATSLADLFFAQGYVHAQDRFWEMDVRRHITAGRLSEMFGDSQVPTDAFLRTLGWRRIAEQELPLLSERSRRILDSYAAGVNAYLADRSGARLSLEYAVLGLQNPDYEPEPWTPADSVAWLKALAWDLRSNMEDEVQRAVMSAAVGVEKTEKLFPPYPYAEHRPIVVGGAVVNGVFDHDSSAPGGTAAGAAAAPVVAAAFDDVAGVIDLLEPWLGPSGPGIGSNSWVVSGEHTTTGLPILANDPHLAPMMPSLWYQAGLHCVPATDECRHDVSGWTMSGLPGVFIGHNDRIAWGLTNLGPDVTDLVLHAVDGDTYLLDGRQVPFTTRSEVIEVAGADPVEITVRETVDGPLISDVADIEVYGAVGRDAPVPAPGSTSTREAPPPRGAGYGVALRWTALTPGRTFDALDAINIAQDWEQFRTAATYLVAPSQNLIYADRDGTIGYQAPGVIPIREGYDGKWPVPGWDSRYTWKGTIPFPALPSVRNPEEGWIVTANQAVIGPDYPFFLTDDWAYGTRSQRIVDLLEAAIAEGPVDATRMRTVQMDAWNGLATFLVPRIQSLPAPPGSEQALALFDGWDYQQTADSAPAALFNAIWRQMVLRMFEAADQADLVTAGGGDRYWEVVKRIWDVPDDFWWDDRTVPGTQTRDETMAASIEAAVQELTGVLDDDPREWRWGALHTLLLRNQTLGDSGVGPIEAIFNRGPVRTAGGESTVDATGWTPANGYEVDWVPSMRQVIDLSDADASTWVNLTGQSGHAFNANYADQVDAWVAGEQFPWAFTRDAVDAAGASTLTLTPGSAAP